MKRNRVNYRKASRNLKQAMTVHSDKMGDEILETSKESLDILQEETPVDTSLMKNSEFTRTYEKGREMKFYRVYSPVYYTFWVHEGTRYQEANPYLERAFYRTLDKVENIIKKK